MPTPRLPSVGSTALLAGFLFAVLWGTTMWLWRWRGETHSSPVAAVIASAFGGAVYGLAMAWFLARKRGRPRAAGRTGQPRDHIP